RALHGSTFPAFRHTCASILFEGGKSIRQVCDWLGHADPAFTLRTYVHLLDAGLGDADFLDEALGGNLGGTQDPGRAAREEAVPLTKTALQRETPEQPQTPATRQAGL